MKKSEISTDGETAIVPTVPSGPLPSFRAMPGRLWRGTGRFWNKYKRAVLALLLCGAAVHTAVGIYGSILVNREIAYIRSQGHPLTMLEAAPPEPPAGQNAAPLYVEADKALDLTKAENRYFGLTQNIEAPEGRDADAILARNLKVIALVRRAGAKQACRFSYDYSGPPYSLTMPYYTKLRRLSKLMALQALREARVGNALEALQDVRTIFAMGRHVQGDPFIVGFLVSYALIQTADKTLAQVLDLTKVSEAQAQGFLASLPPMDWTAAYQHALQGERVFGVRLFDDVRSNPQLLSDLMSSGSEPSPWRSVPARLLWGPLLKMDQALYLRSWRRAGLHIGGPMQVPARRNGLPHPDGDFNAVPMWAIVTRTLLPVFARVRQYRDAAEVWNREREIALALAVYRSAHGEYPRTLREAAKSWGDELPLDLYDWPLESAAPANNGPFKYARRGKSFLLYSIGPNRKDDDGRNQRDRSFDRKSWEHDDLRWNEKGTLDLLAKKP